MKIKKTKGTLTLKEVDFEGYLVRTVHKCNDTSGKITLPHELIGQQVYVIVKKIPKSLKD